MEIEILQTNASIFEREFQWLSDVITARLQMYFQQASDYESVIQIPAPDLTDMPSNYAKAVLHYPMTIPERLVLLLALAPHIKPQILDPFFMKNTLYDRGYSEFGGVLGQQHSGFIPTGETALFLLAGDQIAERIGFLRIFDEAHYFFQDNILRLENPIGQEPFLSGTLSVSRECLASFTNAAGKYSPKDSAQLPAKRITTQLEWKDLVLDPQALEEIEELISWLENHQTIMRDWQLDRVIKPGYHALFYGPPGTGKTMTAALLGKLTRREVYSIDLSQVVSRYIGETEKNLAGIFDRAENSNWILFFDEADALFGKRTSTTDANDRYANQEVAYLLQRIEDYPGVAILATNFKGNIDDAFIRRFQSKIFFPTPNADQRLRLWRKAFPEQLQMSPDIDWEKIAQEYEISGGGIINVLQFCALSAVQRTPPVITQNDLLRGIRKEL